MRYLLLCLAVFGVGASAHAAVKTEAVAYRHGDTELEGYLAYDDAVQGKRPGILVVPEWWGLGDHAKHSAERLAELGYVAFAVDMYGKGKLTKDPKEAAEWATPFRNDRQLMRDRVTAALDVLRANERVDSARIGAIGYCFGGTTVLELARSGADVKGVVSFHGGLGTPNPADAKNIKGRVLALHGADDPHVPPAEVQAFEQEMRDAKVDWELNAYGGAVHSFTNPAAGDDPSKGAAYNQKAAERSWEAMRYFFATLFPRE
jgi:dienelactone hydrolase